MGKCGKDKLVQVQAACPGSSFILRKCGGLDLYRGFFRSPIWTHSDRNQEGEKSGSCPEDPGMSRNCETTWNYSRNLVWIPSRKGLSSAREEEEDQVLEMMEGTRMEGTRMEGTRMEGTRMEGTRMEGTRMEGTRGPGGQLQLLACGFQQLQLLACGFQQLQLVACGFQQLQLQACSFQQLQQQLVFPGSDRYGSSGRTSPRELIGVRRPERLAVTDLSGEGSGADVLLNAASDWSVEQKLARHSSLFTCTLLDRGRPSGDLQPQRKNLTHVLMYDKQRKYSTTTVCLDD
ncbi:uncharacterized protein V6R79_016798 [Siganus canaliculatus]